MNALVFAALAALTLTAPPARAQDARHSRRYFFEQPLEPFFALDAAAGRYVPRREGASAASFAAVKAPGTFRAFVIGSSIAKMYDRHEGELGDALGAVLPRGLEPEVINCGMSGYDSARELPIVREVLDYAPDLVVLLVGHNDSKLLAPPSAWRLRLARALERVGLAPLAARLAAQGPRLARAVSPNAPLDRLEANVRAMLAACASRGVPAVLLVPPLNARDGAPDGGAARRPAARRGWARALLGDCPAARREWATLTAPEEAALGAFFSGRCLEREGKPEEARAAYARALALEEPLRGRCGPACAERLARAARERKGLIADPRAAFLEAAAPDLPGVESFSDRVHWRPSRTPEISAALVGALWGDPRLAPRLRAAGPPSVFLVREAGSWHHFAEEAPALETLRAAAAALESDPGAFSPGAWALLDGLRRWDPAAFGRAPALLAGMASGAAELGRPWGARAIRVSPSLFRWHWGDARLWGGDARGAREALAEAERLGADGAPFWADVWAASRRAGDASGAARALSRLRALDPEAARDAEAALRPFGAPGRTR